MRTLHLHFFDADYGKLNPTTKPKLVMTEYWPESGPNSTVMTFGSKAVEIPKVAHSTKADTLALAQLLLRHKPIEGGLARSLNEVARKVDHDGKATWLQQMFGLDSGRPFPADLIRYSAELCELGPEMKEAAIEVFVHRTVAEVLGAYRPQKAGAELAVGKRKRQEALQALDMPGRIRLANRMLGAVQIEKLTIEVDKETRGVWKAVGSGVLPLTSKDVFKLVVECNREAHIYAAWVWSSGDKVTPIFPWIPTAEWDKQKAEIRDVPREKLVLTDEYEEELPGEEKHLASFGEEGAETLVVIAHVTPLDLDELKRYFEGVVKKLGRKINYRTRGELEEIPIERVAVAEAMDFRLSKGAVGGALEELKGRLERLPMEVDACRALVIPTLGGE